MEKCVNVAMHRKSTKIPDTSAIIRKKNCPNNTFHIRTSKSPCCVSVLWPGKHVASSHIRALSALMHCKLSMQRKQLHHVGTQQLCLSSQRLVWLTPYHIHCALWGNRHIGAVINNERFSLKLSFSRAHCSRWQTLAQRLSHCDIMRPHNTTGKAFTCLLKVSSGQFGDEQQGGAQEWLDWKLLHLCAFPLRPHSGDFRLEPSGKWWWLFCQRTHPTCARECRVMWSRSSQAPSAVFALRSHVLIAPPNQK